MKIIIMLGFYLLGQTTNTPSYTPASVTHFTPFHFAPTAENTTLFLSIDGRIFINCKTGRVTLDPGLKLDKASKLFWKELEHARLVEPPSGYTEKDVK